jgi:hypothetical protein
MPTIKPQIEKDGRLRSITVVTDQLEFWYARYEEENAVGLNIQRKLDEFHVRTLDAHVQPDVAEKLIDAFMNGGSTGAEETWKHVFAIADTVVSNFSKVAAVRIGDDSENGVAVSFGYKQEPTRIYIYADAKWKNGNYTCDAYEGDYMERQEDVKTLRHYLKNVLDLVKICIE